MLTIAEKFFHKISFSICIKTAPNWQWGTTLSGRTYCTELCLNFVVMCKQTGRDDTHSLNDTPKLSHRLELLSLLLLPVGSRERKERKDYGCARAFEFKKASDTMGGKSEPFCVSFHCWSVFMTQKKNTFSCLLNILVLPLSITWEHRVEKLYFFFFPVFVQTSYNFRLTVLVLPLQRQNLVIGYVEQFQAWEMKLRAIITKGFASATFTGFRLGTPALPDDQSGRSGSAGDSPRAAKRDTVSGRFDSHPMPGLAEKHREGEARLQLDQKPRSVSQRPGVRDVGGHVSGRQHSDHQRRPQIGDIFVRHLQFTCARLHEHPC